MGNSMHAGLCSSVYVFYFARREMVKLVNRAPDCYVREYRLPAGDNVLVYLPIRPALPTSTSENPHFGVSGDFLDQIFV